MSFNNYKPAIAVVRDAKPTPEQLNILQQELGLVQQCDLDDPHFVAWVGGLRAYGSVPTDDLEFGLEIESVGRAYPEYVESDAVFDTIDELIEALKP